MFKIFSPSQNKFSNGGIEPSFNKSGKFWNTVSILNNHLNQRTGYIKRKEGKLKTSDLYADDDVVIEYKLVEVSRTPVDEWMRNHEKENML